MRVSSVRPSSRSASCWLGVTTVGRASMPSRSASPPASSSVFTFFARAMAISFA